jgi:hypothetical protein
MTPYMTVEEADTYFDTYRLVTDAWDAASTTQKTKALLLSTKLIDQLQYDGDAVGTENQFPRGTDTEVPEDIKQACAECAYSLLDGVDIEMEFDNLWTTGQSIANVRNTQRTEDVPEYKLVGIPSYMAWRLLKPYFRLQNPVTLMRT